MSFIATLLCWVFLLVGGAFVLIGNIGLLRLPDFYTRLHAAGITDTLGAGLILVALCFHAGFSLITVKLLFIIGFLLITSPTASHALAKSALHGKLKPLLPEKEKSPSNT